jgi:hypothetical protein
MGKARDGSNCYTRVNNAGGKYVTCEGQQKANRKLNREISKLHGRTRVGVTKDEFNEARASLRQTLNNAVVAEKPGVVAMTTNWNRSDTVRGQSRRAAKARRLTTRPPGRIETGSLNPGGIITEFDTSQFVSEAPGVVGMTSTMSPLGQATYDALFNAGFDVSRGISAAVAAREKDLWHFKKSNPNVLEFEGQYYLKLRNTPLTFQEFQDWTERSSDMGEDPIDDVIFDEWRRWTEFGEGDIFFAVDVVDISRNRVDVVDGQITQRRIDEVVLGKRQSRFSDIINIEYELKILPLNEDGEPLAPDDDTLKTFTRYESIPYGRMPEPPFNEEQRDKYFKPGDLGYKILLPAPEFDDPVITRNVNDL